MIPNKIVSFLVASWYISSWAGWRWGKGLQKWEVRHAGKDLRRKPMREEEGALPGESEVPGVPRSQCLCHLHVCNSG
jgi:hypothetical protein